MNPNITILLSKKGHQDSWESDAYRVRWEGLVFIEGALSGEESIKEFVKRLSITNMETACQNLKGIFLIIIESKKSGDIHVFGDNAGLYHIYYSRNTISNSFLGLVKHDECAVRDMNPATVAEFIHFGWVSSTKTYFDSIKKIQRDNILFIPNGSNDIKMLKKSGMDLNNTSDVPLKSFEECFHLLSKSLSNCRVSVDLTAGIDTRLVAAMLSNSGLTFETASSGGTMDYVDVSVSGKIAQIMGKPWFATIHSISALESELDDVFHVTDGLYDVLYYHRLYKLQKARQRRGINTMISGVGGELFKDHWWLHEFPFYYKKDSNIKKFVDMRMMSFDPMQNILTSTFTDAGNNLKTGMTVFLSNYTLDRNTRTFDNIFYNVIMADLAGQILTSHSNFLKCYAPFLDLDVARIGFNLKRTDRVYNLFHRKEMTRINPTLAKYGTSENEVTVSYDTVDMVSDLPKYFTEKFKRLLIKCNLMHPKDTSSLNAKNFCQNIRNMKTIRHSIDILKDTGIVNKDVQLQDVSDKYLGTLLSLSMLVKYI
jgi:asparagine synthetase B (glutamine-hydrolysing)